MYGPNTELQLAMRDNYTYHTSSTVYMELYTISRIMARAYRTAIKMDDLKLYLVTFLILYSNNGRYTYTCYVIHLCQSGVFQSQLSSESNQVFLAQGLKVVDDIIMMVVFVCMYVG